MADISKIIAQVLLEADQAIAKWKEFGDAGIAAFNKVALGAAQANARVSTSVIGISKSLDTVSRSAVSVGKQIKGLGQSISIAVGLPLGLLAKKAVDAFNSQEAALANLRNALDATGGKAKVSMDELVTFAENAQRSFAVSDDAVENAQTVLLKFGNVTGDVFRQAQQVVIDFAARTHTDLDSAAQAVGLALNSPVQAMRILRQAGIALTAGQKATIASFMETGQVAKAQKVILDLLAKSVSGAAKAFAETDLGKFQIAMNAVDDALEKVGGRIAPVLTKLAQGLAFVAVGFGKLPPKVQTVITSVGLFFIALGPVLFVVGAITTAIGKFGIGLAGLLPLIVALGPGIIVAVVALSLMAQAQGGWNMLLANSVIGLAAVLNAIGQLLDGFDNFRRAVQGLPPVVPRDWGITLLQAGVDMRNAAKEANKLAGETTKASKSVGGFGALIDKSASGLSAAENATNALSDATDSAGKEYDHTARMAEVYAKAVEDARQRAGAVGKTDMSPVTRGVAQLTGGVGQLSSALGGVVKQFQAIGALKGSVVGWQDLINRRGGNRGISGREKVARGGFITGPGTSTSDSIPAWLSNREFVHRARAVAKYGLGFMRAVNEGRFPLELARRFSFGGLVQSYAPQRRFAAGGLVTSGALDSASAFTLVIDRETFSGLTIPGAALNELMAFARASQVQSGGVKPVWFK